MYEVKLNSIDVDNYARLNSLDVSAAYLDALFLPDRLRLILNSGNVFAMQDILDYKNTSGVTFSCRIPRRVLQGMLSNMNLVFTEQKEAIRLDFIDENGSKLRNVTFNNQIVFNQRNLEKIKILEADGMGNEIDLQDLEKVAKIAKQNKGLINIDLGLAQVSLGSNARVYKRVGTKLSFALDPSAISILEKCGNKAFSYESYICSRKENLGILLSKARFKPNIEFNLIDDETTPYKACYVSDVDLFNLKEFLSKNSLKGVSAELDFDTRECTISYENIIYRIPILVKSEKRGGSIPVKLTIEIEQLTTILFHFPSAMFHLKVMKNFVKLETSDYIAVF